LTQERLIFGEESSDKGENASEQIWESPLADRVRPEGLQDFAGQDHLLAPGAPLRTLIEDGRIPSCILYGPPGVGKTTLVRLMASETDRKIMEINAVSAKVSQLRDLVTQAEHEKRLSGGRAVIAFVDEIYHFNKSQQNALLPSVEKGDIILVGTTTENPFFEINKTLLSRVLVFELKPLKKQDLVEIMERALSGEKGLSDLDLAVPGDVLEKIAEMSGGDARQALTRLESLCCAAAAKGATTITGEMAETFFSGPSIRFDKAGDDHYDVISALIKSMRGSDPDAAVYWLGRLVAGGENLRFLTRRMMIFASEDIGLADPNALDMAVSAAYAADHVGYPEAKIILSQAVLYLACAPKSNSSYMAIKNAERAITEGKIQEVPEHLKQGGTGYQYPHDAPEHWLPQKYTREPVRFFFPGSLGYEKKITARLKRFWRRFRDSEKKDGRS